MAIKINDFMGILKREGRYGTPAVTNDQPTLDILNAINMRITRIWGAKNWPWQKEKLAFAVTPGTVQYSVTSLSGNAIDRILNIIPNDPTVSPPVAGRPLDQMEIGEFYRKTAGTVAPPGLPTKYVNLGMTAAGVWQIVIWPGPSVAFTMSGFAKAVLSTYTLADVLANNPILYFPNGVVLDSLFEGCMIDIGLIQGNTPEISLAKDEKWEKKIHNLAVEQMGADRDNSPLTSPMPDRIQRRMSEKSRFRRNGRR